MLAHPYQGVFHDANLYTLQALAHLHPVPLAHDVFLRYGSQDQFTVFSPIFAAAVRVLRIEHAAALLTIGSQAALVAAAWYLAQQILPPRLALLGVGILLAIPGNYGPGQIFACIEPFLTPRMAEEACAVAGLAAALSRRWVLSGAWLALSFGLHPVMAMAGAIMLFMSFVAQTQLRITLLTILVGMSSLMLAAFALPAGKPGTLDADWLRLVTLRSPYLFLTGWRLPDFARASVILTTLSIGAISARPPLRRLCRSALLTMTAGLALTLIACDWLHLTLMTQMQPWRWEWIAVLVAALSLPAIVVDSWNVGAASRATPLLLLSAWVCSSASVSLIISAVAVSSLAASRLKPRELQLVLRGAYAVLALAVLWRVASNLEFSELHYMDDSLPLWLRRAMSFAHDGLAPALVLGMASWASHKPAAIAYSQLFAALALIGIAVIWPATWGSWRHEEFTHRQIARFAAWRILIPPDAEIFWGESPLATWALLDRPSYISGLQTSGMIFSRTAALEFERRAVALSRYLDPATFLSYSQAGAHLSVPPETLRGICATGAFDYLVTRMDLGIQPLAILDRLKLYRCAAPQARAAAAAT